MGGVVFFQMFVLWEEDGYSLFVWAYLRLALFHLSPLAPLSLVGFYM